ncbi:MAG: hypothetical protein WA824_09900, partial [Candidatus Sulfotelmatobacter sp.]
YCATVQAAAGFAAGTELDAEKSGLRPDGQPGAAVPTWPVVDRPAFGKLYEEPTEADRYQMIRTYFSMLIEEELPDAVGKMKQFASWFTHGVPGGAALRKEIYESKSDVEVLRRVEEFFEARLCGAGTLARETAGAIVQR